MILDNGLGQTYVSSPRTVPAKWLFTSRISGRRLALREYHDRTAAFAPHRGRGVVKEAVSQWDAR